MEVDRSNRVVINKADDPAVIARALRDSIPLNNETRFMDPDTGAWTHHATNIYETNEDVFKCWDGQEIMERSSPEQEALTLPITDTRLTLILLEYSHLQMGRHSEERDRTNEALQNVSEASGRKLAESPFSN